MPPQDPPPTSRKQDDGKTTVRVELDWTPLDDLPLHSVNLFLAQGVGDHVALWFGRVAPPVAVAVSGKTKDPMTLPVAPAARLMLPKGVARDLMRVLQANLGDDPGDSETDQ